MSDSNTNKISLPSNTDEKDIDAASTLLSMRNSETSQADTNAQASKTQDDKSDEGDKIKSPTIAERMAAESMAKLKGTPYPGGHPACEAALKAGQVEKPWWEYPRANGSY